MTDLSDDSQATSITNPRKRAIFDQLVARDGETCRHCGCAEDLTLDHVDPAGPDILENLQLLCRSCNSEKGNRTSDETVRWADSLWQRGFTMVPNAILLDLEMSPAAFRALVVLIHLSWRPESEWPGQEGLARLAQCSERTLRTALEELRKAKLVRSRRRGQGLTNSYVLTLPTRSAISAGQNFRAEETAALEPTLSAGLSSCSEDLDQEPPTSPPLPAKVDRVAVSEMEGRLAVEVLAAYNEFTGQSFAGKDWLSKIVMRIREHPDLDLEAHQLVLEVAFRDPWWKGRPAPSVVYGNAALFEKCLDAARAAPLRAGDGQPRQGTKFGRRDVSAGELLALADQLERREEIESATG